MPPATAACGTVSSSVVKRPAVEITSKARAAVLMSVIVTAW